MLDKPTTTGIPGKGGVHITIPGMERIFMKGADPDHVDFEINLLDRFEVHHCLGWIAATQVWLPFVREHEGGLLYKMVLAAKLLEGMIPGNCS